MIDLLLPGLIFLLFLLCGLKRLHVYDLFVKGAAEGLQVGLRVLPSLAAMLCAISLLEASGLMGKLVSLFTPLFRLLNLPPETAPLALLRPLSGSASLAMLESLFENYGADSRIGLVASTLMGSGETIFYTLCVYMSGAKNKHTGCALPASLLGALAAMAVCGFIF